MSLDSTFLIDAGPSSPGALKQILRAAGFADMADRGRFPRVFAEATEIAILQADARDSRCEEAQVRATHSFFISNNDKENTAAWTLHSVRAVAALLRALPGDALFLFHDAPALLRKDGRVLLDPRCGLWARGVEPDALALIDPPYAFEIVPVT